MNPDRLTTVFKMPKGGFIWSSSAEDKNRGTFSIESATKIHRVKRLPNGAEGVQRTLVQIGEATDRQSFRIAGNMTAVFQAISALGTDNRQGPFGAYLYSNQELAQIAKEKAEELQKRDPSPKTDNGSGYTIQNDQLVITNVGLVEDFRDLTSYYPSNPPATLVEFRDGRFLVAVEPIDTFVLKASQATAMTAYDYLAEHAMALEQIDYEAINGPDPALVQTPDSVPVASPDQSAVDIVAERQKELETHGHAFFDGFDTTGKLDQTGLLLVSDASKIKASIPCPPAFKRKIPVATALIRFANSPYIYRITALGDQPPLKRLETERNPEEPLEINATRMTETETAAFLYAPPANPLQGLPAGTILKPDGAFTARAATILGLPKEIVDQAIAAKEVATKRMELDVLIPLQP